MFFSKDRGIAGEKTKEDQGIKSSTHRDGCALLGTVIVFTFVLLSSALLQILLLLESGRLYCVPYTSHIQTWLSVTLYFLLKTNNLAFWKIITFAFLLCFLKNTPTMTAN